MHSLSRWLNYTWYYKKSQNIVLLLLSQIYFFFYSLRLNLYKFLPIYKSKIPVWVVGNITVGGNGKSAFVAWCAKYLISKNYKIAIVSKGYKRKSSKLFVVTKKSNVQLVGDEPLMLANKCNCLVIVSCSRVESIKYVEKNYPDIDIILLDDGMQDLSIRPNVVFNIISSCNMFGNNKLLPLGPLREPLSKLHFVDANILISQGVPILDKNIPNRFDANISPKEIYHLTDKNKTIDMSDPVYFVSAIAHQRRVIKTLEDLGFSIIKHYEFIDHYQFKAIDFNNIPLDSNIVITEKDAIKCELWHPNIWVLSIDLNPNQKLLNLIDQLTSE